MHHDLWDNKLSQVVWYKDIYLVTFNLFWLPSPCIYKIESIQFLKRITNPYRRIREKWVQTPYKNDLEDPKPKIVVLLNIFE